MRLGTATKPIRIGSTAFSGNPIPRGNVWYHHSPAAPTGRAAGGHAVMSTAFDPLGLDTPGAGDPGVSAGDAFEALANQRRRHVVRVLSAAGSTELRPLSRRVAALENDKPPAEVTPAERRRVYNALQQFHLPKLDDAGAVDYDARRGTVTPTDGLERLEAYLELPRRGRGWCRYTLAAGTVAAALAAVLLVASTLPALAAAAVTLPVVVAAAGVARLLTAGPTAETP